MNPTWNRRTFLAALGLSTAAGALPATADTVTPEHRSAAAPPNLFAALIFGGTSTTDTAVAFYHVVNHTWTLLRTISLPDAQAITLHPTKPVAYIGRHSHASDPFPRAWITALSRDGGTLQHQPLSLSGTFPTSLAISPDGRSLLVALKTGNAYNIISVSPDGELGPVTHRRKQTGSGPDPTQTSALPHSVLFHPSGAMAYSTDHGADRLNMFEIAGHTLLLRDHITLPPGSGPATLALHPAGDRLFFITTVRGALSSLTVDPATGRITGPLTSVATSDAASLAIHPSGRFLYLAHNADTPSLSIWRLAHGSPLPRRVTTVSVPRTTAIHVSHDQVLLATENGLLSAILQPRSGLPGSFQRVVSGGTILGLALSTV